VSSSFASAVHRRALLVGSAGAIETDYHNHTNRDDAPAYRLKRGTDWTSSFEPVSVPRCDGFHVELDAFADLVARRAGAAIAAHRAVSLDTAWMLEAIATSARGNAS
jgi:xylose dehydrogenase (NAD/NADP)